MNLLLDTHLLLWAAGAPDRLSVRARDLIEDTANTLIFSVASLWEISIKSGLGRVDFQVEPALLLRGLLDNGYQELPVIGRHAIHLLALPTIHRDPFDRMLVAQANVEGLTLLTADEQVAKYSGPIRLV